MEKKIGVYIHIPFCASKCAYCDFYSLAGCDGLMPKYQTAVIRHIRETEPMLSSYLVDTVYFGGGTPSYYGTKRILGLFDALKRYANVLLDSEVTIEVNPDSITLEDMKKLRRAGVNRLSIGAQCADDGILKSLGRRHDWAQVEQTVQAARDAGFDNVSLDLIYGLPSQTRDGWAETLQKAVALKPEHLSCYGLKIEEGTELYLYRDYPGIPDDDAQADMYLYAVETLERYGYQQYEISNFALPGRASKHNLKYWQLQEYVGFGAAAYSCMNDMRFSCVKDLTGYISAVLNKGVIIGEQETISPFEKAGEYLMLGLRTTRGISEEEYRQIYRSEFGPIEELLQNYEKKGWTRFVNGRWSFTPQGFLLSNSLIGETLDAQAEQKAMAESIWKSTGYQGIG